MSQNDTNTQPDKGIQTIAHGSPAVVERLSAPVKVGMLVWEEPRMCTCPDDKTLLDLIDRATPHPAVDFLKEARSLSQAALDTALILACQYGFKYLVHKLVQLGADIECRDVSGKTPLLICVENRYLDLVRFLVARGADVKVVDCAGNNALILSISFAGSKEMTQFLLQQADILINHQNQDGYTAVMKALEVMDVDAMHLLLNGYLSKRFSGQSSHTYQNESNWTLLDQTVNCKGETAQHIAEKYGLGNFFTLLKVWLPEKSKPIRAAVGSWDLETMNFILDFVITEKNDMDVAVFQLFVKYCKNKNVFTKVEETMLKRLVECGADLKSFASHHYTTCFLLCAVDAGNYNLVEVLCKIGASPNHLIKGGPPLSVAAKHGRMDLMELLLKYNAEVNTNDFNISPLNCALIHGQTDCARFLVDHGAKVDIMLSLTSAVKSQVPECMKFLCQHYESEANCLLKQPKDGNSLLVEAVRGGNQEIIEQILQAGVDINEPQSSGATPIVESKNGAVAQFLISRGADVNLVTNGTKRTPQIRTPLIHVVKQLKYADMCSGDDHIKEVISVLLKHGACVNARTSEGRTPLMLAAAVCEKADILQMLLDHGAVCTARDKKGNTALVHATVAGCSINAHFLIQFMKNDTDLLNVQNNRGFTALVHALFRRYWDIALHLIDNGADVNVADVDGNTALFLAINLPLPNHILDSLIRAGCNVNHQNDEGLSPLMQAVGRRNYDGAVSLLALGADVNAVNHKDTSKTVLSYFTNNLDMDAISCLEALLDRGANASYLSLRVFFTIISEYPYKLIPKLIRCGLAPFDYSFDEMTITLKDRAITLSSLSPLRLALLKGKATRARYFWENVFLTNLDLSLASNNDVRQFLQETKYEECLSFVDEISSQPMSLFRMCLVAVSSAIGASPGREARVEELPLPFLLKDKLLFKSEVVNLDQPQGRDDNPKIPWYVPGVGKFNCDFLMDSDDDCEYFEIKPYKD